MQKLSLVQWFALWLFAMVILIIFTQPEDRIIKINTLSYGTTESAQLYFSNVRSFYYAQVPEGEGMFDVYRLKSLYQNAPHTFIPFAIYDNWRLNEAYIRIDTTFLDTRKWNAVKAESPDGEIRTIEFPEPLNESQYEFARDLYYALKSETTFSIISDAGVEFPISPAAMRASQRTLTDYFRLTGKL